MLTDTHCHLGFDKFDADREAVIQRASEAGVTRILIPALDYTSSLAILSLADSHPGLFAAIGFHPTNLDEWDETSIENLRESILHHPPPPSASLRDASRSPTGRGQSVAFEIGGWVVMVILNDLSRRGCWDTLPSIQ